MDQVDQGIHPRHVEARRPTLDGQRLLASASGLVQIVDLPKGRRRVVQKHSDGPSQLPSERDHRVEARDRLLVATHRGQEKPLHPAPAQQRLPTARVDSLVPRRPGQLKGPLVAAGPVVRVGQHVIVFRQIRGLGAGNPQLQGALSEIYGAVEVTFVAPHAVALAQPTHRRPDELPGPQPLCHLQCLPGQFDHLPGPLGPLAGPGQSQHRLELVHPLEAWDQGLQGGHSRIEILESHQGQALKEPDSDPSGVVRRQLVGPLEQAHGVVLRHRFLGPLGGQQQIVDRPRRLPGLLPMVSQEPGQVPVHLAGNLLDVPRHRFVGGSSLGSGERGVTDVADQDVPEAEFDVPPHPAGGLAADELPRLQGVQQVIQLTGAPEGTQGSLPEGSADDGGGQERAPLLGREGVDPCGDGRPNRGGELPSDVGSLQQRRGELFEEQGIPFRHPHQAAHRVSRKVFTNQVADDGRGFGVGQRIQRDRGVGP